MKPYTIFSIGWVESVRRLCWVSHSQPNLQCPFGFIDNRRAKPNMMAEEKLHEALHYF